MATYLKKQNLDKTELSANVNVENPHWFSQDTGIYSSTFPSINLPSDPFLDFVSFTFSKKHNGVSALIDSSSGFSISYSQLYPFVKSMATDLQQMGVKQGDVVLILLPNSIYFPVIFLGVLYLGAVASPMNPLSSFSELENQTLDCHAKFAFTLADNANKFITLGIPAIVVPERLGFGSIPSEFSHFYKLISSDSSLLSRPIIIQQDTAAILYSSGTTGSKKGVVLTHRNFIATVELFVRFDALLYEQLSWEKVYLAVIPMFHAYGLCIFVGLFSLGSSIVVMRKYNAGELPIAIHNYSLTHFPVVPPLLAALTRAAHTGGGSKLKSLKQVSSDATFLSTKSIEDFVRALPHVDFIQCYGMTEASLEAQGFNTESLHNYSSVGLLTPIMEAKVVDVVTGGFKGPDGIGYLNSVEATMSTIDKEDICYFDKNGYLYIIERVKEIIKCKGFQIAPTELEAILVSHPEVLDVAVTAARDEEAGEVLVAFVVKNRGSEISEAALIDYVAKQVAPYKKVRKVVFTHSTPRSIARKILRRELKKLFTSNL